MGAVSPVTREENWVWDLKAGEGLRSRQCDGSRGRDWCKSRDERRAGVEPWWPHWNYSGWNGAGPDLEKVSLHGKEISGPKCKWYY